jgi:hypothetical protein
VNGILGIFGLPPEVVVILSLPFFFTIILSLHDSQSLQFYSTNRHYNITKPRSLNNQSRTSEMQRRSTSSRWSSTLSGSSMERNNSSYRATSYTPSEVTASMTVQYLLSFSCDRAGRCGMRCASRSRLERVTLCQIRRKTP